jgi:hypothetical protein
VEPPTRTSANPIWWPFGSISFVQKFGLFREQWQPKVIAEMNDYQSKVVKLGDFIWHDHKTLTRRSS